MARPSQTPPSRRDQDRRRSSNNVRHDRRTSRHTSQTALLEPSPRHSKTLAHNDSSDSSAPRTTSNPLSQESLAKLNAINAKRGLNQDHLSYTLQEKEGQYDEKDEYERDVRRESGKRRDRRRITETTRTKPDQRRQRDGGVRKDRRRSDQNHYRDTRRVVSGPLAEEGRNYKREYNGPRRRGGGSGKPSGDKQAGWRKKKKWICIGGIIAVIVLIIIIAVAVTQSQKNSGSDDPSYATNTATPPPPNNNLDSVSRSDIPIQYRGTYYDPFDWYDTGDFNVTFTTQTVGGLPVMGLFSSWDDTTRANQAVPPLNQPWQYGVMPIRGMNVGGWLSIEPFITPSFFVQFDQSQGVVDEWTLCETLGTQAAATLEKHYSSFVTENTFAEIKAAGFDHVRIPFSYWAVTVYDGDPYVPMIAWRYLLRGIEWARKYGLRVNLDIHGMPGSQNGWNHSGHQGYIGWLNGTDGDLNAQRSLDIHRQLSAFFAQERYKNLVTMYGLVNEPRMVDLNTQDVLDWSTQAIDIVRSSGMSSSVIIVIGDGFLGLANWQGLLSGYSNILLDAHQYVIFNNEQIKLGHTDKMHFACDGWSQQSAQSMDPNRGFGTFMCGEWSQADTDCTTYLNNVGAGSRWEGTLILPNMSLSVLNPQCPTDNDPPCDCDPANADPSSYSQPYKQWLRMFAEAQMHSYEVGWGWFYWTWYTEASVQWSYKLGMQAGILPTNARKRNFNCESGAIPDFTSLGLSETY